MALACVPATAVFAEQPASARCTQLAGLTLPADSIELPTAGATVVSAQMSAPADPNGEFCQVLGAIHPVDPAAPDINFQLNLPEQWNGKALHFGGGGYNGTVVTGLIARYSLPDSPPPVKTGYATFGSDSGHTGTAADASFALNNEALENFGSSQLRKTHDAALQLILRYYGRTPTRLYFQGASQGGHEAFIVMQRWPELYDGIVAIHPVYNMTALQLSGVHLGQTLYGSPGAWLSPGKLNSLHQAVLRACDRLDGVADGIVSNVAACRSTFELESLRCRNGRDTGERCLSDAQLATVRAFDSPLQLGVELQSGVRSFSRWPILEGGTTDGRFHLGRSPTPARPPGPQDAFIHVMGDQMVRYMMARDPQFDSLRLDPGQHAERLLAVSELVDANSVELEPFRKRGGKLLLTHGTVDMAVPPQNTIDYYERLAARFGPKALDEFVRFYVIPGFGHGDGPFVAGWDWLGAIDAWVEQGRAPEKLVAVDTAEPTAGRTRPLCEYPAWPRYRGSGDADSADSFECVRN